MAEYTLSSRTVAIILLPIAVVYGILAVTPERWDFPIIIGYVLLNAVAWIYVFYRARKDEKVKSALEDFADSEYWDARTTTFDRIWPGGILTVMLMTQVIVAHRSLPETDREALATVFSTGPIEIGVFRLTLLMIGWWVIGPTVSYFATRVLKAVHARWVR